jgi:hypothetical protein
MTRDWIVDVSTLRLTVPVVPPPVRPAPAVTPVMSPRATSVPHVTAPFAPTAVMKLPVAHVPVTRDWIVDISTLRLIAPVVPPPVRPAPAVTALMSPVSVRPPHVTAPFAPTAVMNVLVAHVPVTRCCTVAGSKPWSVSATSARVAYGTVAMGMRGDSTSPSTVSSANNGRPSKITGVSPLVVGSIEPRLVYTRPFSTGTLACVSSHTCVPPVSASNNVTFSVSGPVTALPSVSVMRAVKLTVRGTARAVPLATRRRTARANFVKRTAGPYHRDRRPAVRIARISNADRTTSRRN